MPLPRPKSAIFDPKRRVSRITFDDDSQGDYHVRGGICWPVLSGEKPYQRVGGYAVMVALNVATDCAVVFEYTEFNAIDAGPHGDAFTKALRPWLWACLDGYKAAHYYWRQHDETHRQYRLQVHQDGDARLRNLVLQEIDWGDDAAAEQVYVMAAMGKRLKIERALADVIKGGAEGAFNPAKHALICALMGLQRWPWCEPPAKPKGDLDL